VVCEIVNNIGVFSQKNCSFDCDLAIIFPKNFSENFQKWPTTHTNVGRIVEQFTPKMISR
jgi:hypothetical protein